MLVIVGYNLGNVTYDAMEAELEFIKKRINKIAKDVYNKLLGEEIAFLCDSVTLNILNRDGKLSIFDAAITNVENRIEQAKNTDNDNPYAFSIYAHILKIDNDYVIKVVTGHERYLSAFKKFKSLCLDEIEINDPNNGKAKFWKRVDKLYKDKPVLSVNLTPERFYPDIEQVKFPEFDIRVKKMAKHSVLNHYMNQLAGGNQIPPFLLMPYFDKAEIMFRSPAGAYEYEKKCRELTQLLIEIKKDSEFIHKA